MKQYLHNACYSFNADEIDMQRGICIKELGFHSMGSSTLEGKFSKQANQQQSEFYTLIYITRGESDATFDVVRHNHLQLGYAGIIPSEKWNVDLPDKLYDWNEYWVAFSGPLFEQFIAPFNPSGQFFEVGINDRIVSLFHDMIACAREQKPEYQHKMAGILFHILGMIFSDKVDNKLDKRYMDQIKQACIIMRENIQNKVSPEDIAEQLNMGYSNFRQLFKQYTGVSPLQYILQLKIEMARDLLVNSNDPVKEIAFNLDFESVEYFSSFFRSKVGYSPFEYRKAHVKTYKSFVVTELIAEACLLYFTLFV